MTNTRGPSPATDSVEGIAANLVLFAEVEGGHAPFYGRLARILAGEPDVCRLLLEAPAGLRRPVLLLAALHDALLRHPGEPLARWFPTITAAPVPEDDPSAALFEFIRVHADELLATIRSRSVQTNEVNRSIAWWLALDQLRRDGLEQLAVLELGCSAGLNLQLDAYRGHLLAPAGSGAEGAAVRFGADDSPVELRGRLEGGSPPAELHLPDIAGRAGLDLEPVDPLDPDDARWLTACVWPEQPDRHARLRAALDLARSSTAPRPPLVAGDLIEALPAALDALPDGVPVVALSSWVITYVARPRRAELFDTLAASGRVAALVAFEPPGALPGVTPPPLPDDAGEEERHASLLSLTRFGDGEPSHRVLARCHSHMAWVSWLA